MTDFFSKIRSVEEKVNRLLQNSRLRQDSNPVETEDDTEIGLLSLFPLMCRNDFLALENKLKETPLLQKKFVKVIMAVGGRDVKSLAINIMRRLMSDQLATAFSYTGKKGYKEEKTESFGNTEMCKHIHAAVRKVYPKATNEVIKKQIMGFLNQAKTRLSRREQDKQAVEVEGAYDTDDTNDK